ncbi:MAG: hypothetical protein WDW36_000332 [Sanguina aurantia]
MHPSVPRLTILEHGNERYPVAMHFRTDLAAGPATSSTPGLPLAWGMELLEFLNEPQIRGNRAWKADTASDVLLAMHVSHGGSPQVRLVLDERQMEAREIQGHTHLHRSLIDSGMALSCVPTKQSEWELMLAPAFETYQGGKGAAWWGYAVKRRLCTRVSGLVSARRLAVVFDLDETLVLAVTRGASLLRKETILKLRWGTVTGHRPASRAHPCLGDGTGVQQARKHTHTCSHPQALVPARPNRAERHSERRKLLLYPARSEEVPYLREDELDRVAEKELKALQDDITMLETFARAGYVYWNGTESVATYEDVLPEGKGAVPVKRKTLRVAGSDPAIVITEMDPTVADSNMLVRVRPGWQALARALIEEGEGGRRFEVYVCTAAQRYWALEAWRILDPRSLLFPADQRHLRIINVEQHGLASQDESKKLARVILQAELRTPAVPVPLPLVVVVDDRADVWDKPGKDCLLQVVPFQHILETSMEQVTYEDPRLTAAVAAVQGSRELDRITAALGQLHTDVQADLARLRPLLAEATADGFRHSSRAGYAQLDTKDLRVNTITKQLQYPATLQLRDLYRQRHAMLTAFHPRLGEPNEAPPAAGAGADATPPPPHPPSHLPPPLAPHHHHHQQHHQQQHHHHQHHQHQQQQHQQHQQQQQQHQQQQHPSPLPVSNHLAGPIHLRPGYHPSSNNRSSLSMAGGSGLHSSDGNTGSLGGGGGGLSPRNAIQSDGGCVPGSGRPPPGHGSRPRESHAPGHAPHSGGVSSGVPSGRQQHPSSRPLPGLGGHVPAGARSVLQEKRPAPAGAAQPPERRPSPAGAAGGRPPPRDPKLPPPTQTSAQAGGQASDRRATEGGRLPPLGTPSTAAASAARASAEAPGSGLPPESGSAFGPGSEFASSVPGQLNRSGSADMRHRAAAEAAATATATATAAAQTGSVISGGLCKEGKTSMDYSQWNLDQWADEGEEEGDDGHEGGGRSNLTSERRMEGEESLDAMDAGTDGGTDSEEAEALAAAEAAEKATAAGQGRAPETQPPAAAPLNAPPSSSLAPRATTASPATRGPHQHATSVPAAAAAAAATRKASPLKQVQSSQQQQQRQSKQQQQNKLPQQPKQPQPVPKEQQQPPPHRQQQQQQQQQAPPGQQQPPRQPQQQPHQGPRETGREKAPKPAPEAADMADELGIEFSSLTPVPPPPLHADPVMDAQLQKVHAGCCAMITAIAKTPEIKTAMYAFLDRNGAEGLRLLLSMVREELA